ncbi:MAG: proline dehydrogenase [Bacteroidetes bacterium]|nr:proline dehydrogenase [Bacteroidota bacterium]
MKKEGKPVDTKFEKLHQALLEAKEATEKKGPVLDFSDTQTAFASKTNEELRKAAWLFRLMNKRWLVEMGSKIGLTAVKLRLPFVDAIVKNTIFEQFCGGTTLLESVPTIEKLYAQNTVTVLDYGAEAKDTEEEFNKTMNETIRSIEFAYNHESVPVVSSKITGMARFGLLQQIQEGKPHTKETREEYDAVLKRLDSICHVASENGVSLFFDAEESWIQDTIDDLVVSMMRRYNKERFVVYNTFQMYRHDRLQFLMDSFAQAEKEGYKLGAKLVRGAYMDKERERAAEKGYPSPIHPDKKSTDDAYNMGIRFCVENYEKIALCNATHNTESCLLMAQLIHERGLPKNHPNLNFCQLLGMSDHLTFNLASAGYNTAKYVVYGAVKEVVPYLIRRAEENTAVTGDMSRELQLISDELKRRKLD